MINSFNQKLKNISILAGTLTAGVLAALIMKLTFLSLFLFLDTFVLSILLALLYSRYNTLNLKKISFVRSIERDFEALKIYKKIDEELFEVPKIKISYQNNKIKKISIENSPIYSDRLKNFDWSATIENAEIEKIYLDKKIWFLSLLYLKKKIGLKLESIKNQTTFGRIDNTLSEFISISR